MLLCCVYRDTARTVRRRRRRRSTSRQRSVRSGLCRSAVRLPAAAAPPRLPDVDPVAAASPLSAAPAAAAWSALPPADTVARHCSDFSLSPPRRASPSLRLLPTSPLHDRSCPRDSLRCPDLPQIYLVLADFTRHVRQSLY